MSTVFEKAIGVAEFAQLIRDAGGSMSNRKLLGIAQSGGFAGYRIYIYQGDAGSVEGWISHAEAERWIAAHSMESKMDPDVLAYWMAEQQKEKEAAS